MNSHVREEGKNIPIQHNNDGRGSAERATKFHRVIHVREASNFQAKSVEFTIECQACHE